MKSSENEEYSIDELHSDLSSIYSDYERGKIDKELAIDTAYNVCQAFIALHKRSDAEPKLIDKSKVAKEKIQEAEKLIKEAKKCLDL